MTCWRFAIGSSMVLDVMYVDRLVPRSSSEEHCPRARDERRRLIAVRPVCVLKSLHQV